MNTEREQNHWALKYISLDMKLNFVAIVFGIGAMYSIYERITMMRLISDYDESIWWEVITDSVYDILFIGVVLLFANRNKAGWFILMLSMMMTIPSNILMFLKAIRDKYFADAQGGIYNSFLELIYPVPWGNITKVVIVSLTIWFLYTKEVRRDFHISDSLGKQLIIAL